jgi:hypothetical protein
MAAEALKSCLRLRFVDIKIGKNRRVVSAMILFEILGIQLD